MRQYNFYNAPQKKAPHVNEWLICLILKHQKCRKYRRFLGVLQRLPINIIRFNSCAIFFFICCVIFLFFTTDKRERIVFAYLTRLNTELPAIVRADRSCHHKRYINPNCHYAFSSNHQCKIINTQTLAYK